MIFPGNFIHRWRMSPVDYNAYYDWFKNEMGRYCQNLSILQKKIDLPPAKSQGVVITIIVKKKSSEL